MARKINWHILLVTVLYGILIAYVSLFPFINWHIPQGNPFAWAIGSLPHHISGKDAVVNVLAYIPFGILVSACSLSGVNRQGLCLRVVFAGFCLSFAMETLQTLLPARNPSLVDLFTNTSGAAIGAVLAQQFAKSAASGKCLQNLQKEWLAPGSDKMIGAGILLLWALSRLSPFVPTLSRPGPIKGITPFLFALQGKIPFNQSEAMVHCCYAVGLALMADAILHLEVRSFRLFAAFVSVVMMLRIFIFDGYLTLEVAVGYMAGIGVAVLIARGSISFRLISAIGFLVAGIVLFEVRPGKMVDLYEKINWIPFRYHLDNTLAGVGLILEGIWPYSGLSLLWLMLSRMTVRRCFVYGGMTVFLVVALLEWQQQFIPGRTADITQAMLAVIGWSFPLMMWNEVDENGVIIR